MTASSIGLRFPRIEALGKYLAGCVLFAVGAYSFIESKFGADPLDTFALGVLRHVPVTVGFVQTGVAVVCLGVVGLWSRSRPPITPVFTFLFCGSLIDLQLKLRWMQDVSYPRILALATGTMLCAYGSALIIMSGFGIRSIDLVAIQCTRYRRWPFWVGKGIIELSLLLAGIALGGPYGIGTVCFLGGVDLLIQPMIRTTTSFFGLTNLGLPPRVMAASNMIG